MDYQAWARTFQSLPMERGFSCTQLQTLSSDIGSLDQNRPEDLSLLEQAKDFKRVKILLLQPTPLSNNESAMEKLSEHGVKIRYGNSFSCVRGE